MRTAAILATLILFASPAWAQQTVIPDNWGKPLAEDPAVAQAREAEAAQKHAAYKAFLMDAMAKAAVAKMQADTERLQRQKAEQ